MEQKPAIPPKPKLSKNDRTQFCRKKSPPRKYSPKVPVQEGEMNKVQRERKSLGAIKIPGIVQRRESLSKDKSPATIFKDVKPVLPERKRQSLAATLPAKGLDNNNLSSVLDKNVKKEPSSVAANSRKEDNSLKDPKRKLSILSQTSPSLGEVLKRSNSACKPASGPQSRLFNVRRKSSDNILDTKSVIDTSQRLRAPHVSNLTRGKQVTAVRGKTQSPGLVKKDSAKSELRTGVNSQAKGSSDRLKSLNPTLIKSKLTPGSSNSRDIKLSVLSPGSKRVQLDKKSRQIVPTPVTKPLQRSKSVVLSDKKLKESKQSPRIPYLDSRLAVSKKLTPDPHIGQKCSSLLAGSGKEYSKNDLSSRIKGDKETILGLKRTLEDNLKKFNVMVLCLQNGISENEELKLRLANKNGEVESLKGSLANLQVSVHIFNFLQLITFLQVAKEKSEADFNKLLHQLSTDIETMCAKHAEEKAALR